MLKAARVKANLPSKKNRRPDNLKLSYVNKNREQHTTQVSLENHPGLIFLVRWPPPRKLAPLYDNSYFRQFSVWVAGNRKSLNQFAYGFPESSIRSDFFGVPFARMLAKIGYSYAIAQRGRDTFSPFVLPLIQEETEDFKDIVGGHPINPPNTSYTHRLSLGEVGSGKSTYLVCDIQLFAKLNAPPYRVVVGSLTV
jgi:hypothetical protein